MPSSHSPRSQLVELLFFPERVDTISREFARDQRLPFKWGTLLHADSCFFQLWERLKQKGICLSEMAPESFQLGQGLNLPNTEFVSSKYLESSSHTTGDSTPIFTSQDGAVFYVANTYYRLVSKPLAAQLHQHRKIDNKIKGFDPLRTSRTPPALILPRGIGRHFCATNPLHAYSASYVEIYAPPNENPLSDRIMRLWCFLNSTVAWLLREVLGRKNLGGGMLKAEAVDLATVPIYLPDLDPNIIRPIYKRLMQRVVLPIQEEWTDPDHDRLDAHVFQVLGLNQSEQAQIHSSFQTMIGMRQQKAMRKPSFS